MEGTGSRLIRFVKTDGYLLIAIFVAVGLINFINRVNNYLTDLTQEASTSSNFLQ